MSERFLTDFEKNENLIAELVERELDSPFYDSSCSYDGYVREWFNIFCKTCNATIATRAEKMDGGYKYWEGPRIDRDTACPKCGALLFDEKAVVINEKIKNLQDKYPAELMGE